ncbi:hypothetical protein AVEN_150628-1 [Araneus ventricosus]|uniref:Uncharacterized protein n=1 Tax=Araneus ventricosus TaxID=182803 RepID=A0A4Y2D2Z7_ARAVE|nr:hypothetical protein AVEN_3713-1 [Araneus ventricosus]GBM11020.1 hypothetical protein AVEN_62061-1 [Araneus ventricosus]GBM11034.1 hypothetical protein AVEN_81807-1 [Araneus ventricosus]GBM11061.1 hypothetical protein AVEN_150628-1 [Araneus ventricosus]
MPTYTEEASNDTVHSNGLSIRASSCLVPDQNNITYDVDLQSAGVEDLSKHQNIAVDSLQYLNTSPSNSFQNSQHSVRLDRSKIIKVSPQSELHSSKSLNDENLESSYPNHKSSNCNGSFQSCQHFGSLERPEIITIDDSQSGLNNSKPVNNENSYPNHKSPERNDSFQNNTVPTSMSQYNISGNLKGKFSIDDKLKCMNNELFNVSQNFVGLEQSEVASVDVSQPDLNNSKPLTNEKSHNIVNVNRMPLEHNDQGNSNPETISDDPESVRSIESKDCDKSKFLGCGDVLVESSLLESVENSKSDLVHFGDLRSENNDDSKSVERTSIPNSTNNRPPSNGIEEENWNELKQLYKLKRLSVQLNRLPSVICRSHYSSENDKADRVSNNSKKLSVVLSKLPHFVRSYATYKIYAQSRERKSALQRKKELESVDKNIPDQGSNLLSVSLENNNSATGNHINNHNVSTSVDVKAVSKKSNFLLQACCSTRPTELANKLHITDVHIMENAATVENNFVPRNHLNQQSLENPVLSFSSHIKKEVDICNQQFVEQTRTPTNPIASTATDMETSCINSDFQSLSSGSGAPTELTTLNSLQVSVPSTSNSNELNSLPVFVPSTSNTNKLNSCPQQSATLTENSYCCDNLYTFELLNREQVPMFAADSPSPSSNASSLEIGEELHQVNDESGCNLSGPHLPSANDGFYFISNYQNKVYTDCDDKSLEDMVAFSLWKTEYQLKYLRSRIKYINETLANVVENRRNMKFLKLRIPLNRLPDSIYEKHVKKKPIMLSSILPTVTKVCSLSENGL